jgi:hypothetical protein
MSILTFATAAVLTLPLAMVAFKDGPLPNMTGGFGEPSCHSCHLDNPINAPGGRLAMTGVPPRFDAGRPYEITVELSRGHLRRGGFELSARFAAGKLRGSQAGTWRLPDSRVQLQPSKDKRLLFVQHATTGTVAAQRGALTWTVEWTAPSTAPGPVRFNVAANASNDDASPLGDYIYLGELTSTAASRTR